MVAFFCRPLDLKTTKFKKTTQVQRIAKIQMDTAQVVFSSFCNWLQKLVSEYSPNPST